MKKFTFMLLSAFIAVAAFAAAPQKRVTQLQKANALTISSKQLAPKAKAVRNLQAPAANKMLGKAQTNMRKAPKKAGVEDLLAMNWMLCSENYEYDSEAGGLVAATPAAGGHIVSFSMVDAETIAIEGFTSDAELPIEGTFALTTDEQLLAEGIIAELCIADGQTLRETDYGPVLISNVSAEEEDTPITGYVYANGLVVFDALWTDVLGGDGEYAGYMWSGVYYSSFALPVNGTMTWEKSGTANEEPVVIDQDPENPKYATVYNFGGEETAIVVTMKPDNKFAIDSQLAFDAGSTYGQIGRAHV